MAKTKHGHIDQRLSDVSINYPQTGYVAQVLFPERAVVKGADEFTTYNKINLFQTPDDNVGKYAEANELKIGTGTDTYSVRNRGLKGFISEEDRDNYDDPLNAEIDETEALTAAILNNREIRAHAAATAISNTSTPGTKWDAGGSDPVGDIQTAKDGMFADPNTIVMSKEVWVILKNHADIIARFGGGFTNTKVVTLEMLAAIFEVDRIVVASARKSTTKAPTAASLARIWSDDVVLAWVDPRGLGRKQPTFGALFAQKLGGGPTFRVRKWEAEEKGVGGATTIQVEHRSIEKVVAEDFGYYLSDVLT